MSWRALELLSSVVLLVLAVGLHQLIRSFGKHYATEVFGATPEIGRGFLILADVAYYLIFLAYILFNVQFERPERWAEMAGAVQLQETLYSVAGICLIIGILHGINVFVLPFIGGILTFRLRLMEHKQSGERV